MEGFTPNGVSHNRGSQFVVGNGGYRDANGGSALSGDPSRQIRDSMSVENVSKSRSNDWIMLPSTPVEQNNNCYCKDMHFPKSVTSGILAPKLFKYPPYYQNRTLRRNTLTSGRWPNSIEDPERETTRSSSNPAISSSISEEEFTDLRKLRDCSECDSTQEHDSTDGHDDIPTTSNQDMNIIGQSTDSLPRHRKRLSRRRKNRSVYSKRIPVHNQSIEDRKLMRERLSKSSSCVTSYNDVTNVHPNLRKVQQERMTSSDPLMQRNCGPYSRSAKRPRDLNICSDHNANSMVNVGSWLANQSFDWIDSTPSHFNSAISRNSSRCWRESGNGFIRREDEIYFGTPTARDVTFNVSGQHYRVDTAILGRFPDTMLGNPEKRDKFWDSPRQEYFLDRHRATFEVIIEYYLKNGALARPDDIPIDIFIHELKFYCLDRDNLHAFLSAEGILLKVKQKPMPKGKVKKFVWNLFEDPESCLIARLVTTLSAMVIALSVVVFCMETVPAFRSMGESSQENIIPTLNKCEEALSSRTELFRPIGDLYAASDVITNTRRKRNAEISKENALPEPFPEYNRKGSENGEHVEKEDHDGDMVDTFDRHVLISTMQRTLSLCASDNTMNRLSKYTLLRCSAELEDAFEYIEEIPIHLILSNVEVHDHEHEDEEHGGEEEEEGDHGEDEDYHEETEESEHNGVEEDEHPGEDVEKDVVNHENGEEENSMEKLGNSPEDTGEGKSRKNRTISNRTKEDTRNNQPKLRKRGSKNKECKSLEIGRIMNSTDINIQKKCKTLLSAARRAKRRKSKAETRRKYKEMINNNNPVPTNLYKGKTQVVPENRRQQKNEESGGNSTINSRRRKHRRVEKLQSNHQTVKRSVEQEVFNNKTDTEHENTTANTNETTLLTLKQTKKALASVCWELDKHSVRSSHAWFVLEARLGGTAGHLFLIESGCIVWFVIEIISRFFSCPNKLKFCMNFLNIIDAVAIMPYFITLIVTSLHTDTNLRPQTATILRTIRLVRMLRILKLSRHSRGLRILGLTLIRSTRVLVLLVCFQMVLAVTFSSIMYYVEYDTEGTQFHSIPGTFWWAIITMTTVGYGDVVPITTWGKITGAFCAIMGILGIAFPVPVIVSNFNYLYNLDSDACKITPEELMGDMDEEQNNENVQKFQDNLFNAVRRNVGSMGGGQEGEPTGQNPAELWNYARRQYHGTDSKKQQQKPQERGPSNKYNDKPTTSWGLYISRHFNGVKD